MFSPAFLDYYILRIGINYVKNQKEHHRVKSFTGEYVELLKEHGIQFDERFLL